MRTSPLLVLVLLLAHLSSLAFCIDVYVKNNCRYDVEVGITYFTDDISSCNYYAGGVDDVFDVQPVCIDYWWPVSAGATKLIKGGISNPCIYLTATAPTNKVELYWPMEATCTDACEHDMKYRACSNAPSSDFDCYYWHKAANESNPANRDGCLSTQADYTWTIACDGYVAPAPRKDTPPMSPSQLLPPPAVNSSNTKSSNTGVIAGAAVAGVAAAGLIVAGGIFIFRRKRKSASVDAHNPDPENNLPPKNPTATSKVIDSAYKPTAAGPNNVAIEGSGGNSSQQIPLRMSSRATEPDNADPLMSYIQSTLATQSIQRGESGLSPHLEPWQIIFSDLIVLNPIGEGSFGRVYKCKWNHTDVAVKILVDSGMEESSDERPFSLLEPSPALMAKLNEEAQIMEKLHHPNIAQFLGLCSSPAALVIEYCARGSLYSVLKKGLTDQTMAAELTWGRRINIAMDTVRGVLNLHARTPPILHRDLKSPNILISASWTAKVTDFNLSKILEEDARNSSAAAMNPRWLAPEVLDGQPASLKSDVYAYGICLWELLTWTLPYGTSNPWGIVSAITRGVRLEIPPRNELPGPQSGNWVHLDSYIQLMQRCWEQQPSARPTFEEIGNQLQKMAP